MTKNEFRYVTIINADIEKVWDALTLPEFTEAYWHNSTVESDWKVGSDITFTNDDKDGVRSVGVAGKILECSRPHRLSYSWSFPRMEEVRDEAPSVVTFVLETVGEATRLSVVHDQFEDGSKMLEYITYGWPIVLSNCKTLLETGQTIPHDLF